ncbi:MAG: hypothetical protein A2092_08600 [Rhodobacteraceae bacterium GWE1_64_9]|nr:MAG: hypothetical protein A2092_08600 [Rhodobacteraceae bacterium GWE1_64_9]
MATTQLAQYFQNSNLPMGSGRDVQSQIAGDTGFLGWVTPDATYVDATSGLIDTFHDRTGLPVTFAASGAGARATLVDNQLAGFACAHFEGSAAEYDDYVSTGLTLATGAAFTFAAILRLQDLAENHAITGRYASITSRAVLQVTSGNLPRLLAENSFATGPVALASGVWELVVGSFDGVDKARLWHRGVTATATSTGGDTASGPLRLGTLEGDDFQAFDGDLGEAIYFSRDLLADPDDPTMNAIKILASQLYNINVGA